MGLWVQCERGECVCEAIGASSMLRLIRRTVDNLRFELGEEISAAETELVLVVLCMLNS